VPDTAIPEWIPSQESLIEDEVEEVVHDCDHCGSEHGSEAEAASCCRYDCEFCGTEYRYEDSAHECCRVYCGSCGADHGDDSEGAYECCRYSCEVCGDWHDDMYGAEDCCASEGSSEDPPYLADIQHHQITVPVIEGRPARLCSLEQELASGAGVVAGLLYQQGVCQDNYVRSYHSSGSGEAGHIHVEEDGSLPNGGGEVVYDRFNLANERQSSTLSKIVGKIRQLRDEHKLVKTSFAAGIHVHISVKAEDGSSLSTRDCAALYELWCYAEDMLYSLSAAGWNRHRQPTDNYGGYCKAVPKFDGTATPAKVWRAMRADRYYGLNFQRLYNAVSRCSCGASTVGDWESCDCGAMNSATIEWRVFNASTLPRTLHAWLVMAHAMTAYCKLHELGTLPVNDYGSQSASEKREVLNHLLDVLPLTEGEKDLILDAANRSPGL
jgi:hypothetical protein